MKLNSFFKLIAIIIILTFIGWGFLRFFSQRSQEKAPQCLNEENGDCPVIMKLESSAFKNNELISSKYTCDGENVNPPLKISDVPGGAKSLVLIVDDSDAPGGTFVHWMVLNMAPETNEIFENSVPTGAIEGLNDFGKVGYGGPCPPSGTHRYFFKLYALDTNLNLLSADKKDKIEKAIENHILDYAQIIGLYSR